MKRFLLKVFVLMLVIGCLLMVLPSGPFWFLWYGERPGGDRGIDFQALLSILGLTLAFSLIGIRILSSIFLDDPKEAEKEQNKSKKEEKTHFIDTNPK